MLQLRRNPISTYCCFPIASPLGEDNDTLDIVSSITIYLDDREDTVKHALVLNWPSKRGKKQLYKKQLYTGTVHECMDYAETYIKEKYGDVLSTLQPMFVEQKPESIFAKIVEKF